jgi:serralysin
VRVAAADVDGDGRADIVTGAGPGGDPRVRVFKVTGAAVRPLLSFLPYPSTFTGGVFVAAGRLGAGGAAIIVGPGPEFGPHIRVFSPGLRELASFFAYDPAFRGEVHVGAVP